MREEGIVMSEYVVFVAKDAQSFHMQKKMFPNGIPGMCAYVVQNEIEGKKLCERMGGKGSVISFDLRTLTKMPEDDDPDLLMARKFLHEHESEDIDEPDRGIHLEGRTSEELIPDVKEMIYKHCLDPQKHTLKEYAEIVGISPRYLSRLIKESENCPFSIFEAHLKIQRTLPLVTGTRLPIVKIANLCQYHQANQFNRYFKMFTGITPTEYRKKYGAPLY